MRKKTLGCYIIFSFLFLQSSGSQPAAQDPMNLRVNVVLVQLNVAVMDSKGNYVTGLRPEDFVITEDKLPQKISTFEESRGASPVSREVARPGGVSASESAREVSEPDPPSNIDPPASLPNPHLNEASVFVLFDTSNYMYRSFVFAQDAITDFVRSMDDASRIAFYSYCRDLSRAIQLTSDRFSLINGVRNSVAGDDAALYNSLLLTVKDAAPLKGRKAIVVFSNGPDNASSIPPEDVAELAQSTGTIIYIISTRQAQEDPVSAAASLVSGRVFQGCCQVHSVFRCRAPCRHAAMQHAILHSAHLDDGKICRSTMMEA